MEEFIFDERKLYYRKNKFELNKQTIVFVHGVSGSSSAWLLYENKFKDKYNILSYDLRGHGKSHRYKNYEDYSIEEFEEDLYQLVKFLGINKFIMVSHSYGTFTALEFISRHEEYIYASILLSPNYDVKVMPSSKPFNALLKITSNFKLPISDTKIRKHVDYSKYLNKKDFNILRNIADLDNTGLQIYLMCTKQAFNLDYKNLLKNIHIPVLIISGKNDKIFPNKYAEEMAQQIPGAEILTIKNTDHIIALNNFKEVSSKIEEFVNKIDNTIMDKKV
ncbi:MAG TPA: alpha/beta hydrolase [Candidatus Paceibacterota bacterium]